MLAAQNLPPWMLWTAAGLAGLAAVSLIAGWLRQRTGKPTPTRTFSVQPLSSEILPPASGAKGSSLRMPKFAPPAPLAAPPRDSQSEQRSTFRRTGNAVLVHLAASGDHRRPVNAWVVDRSRTGLRLACESELRVGQGYTVRPAQAPPDTPWCAVEVRHCAATDGHWEAGCRFMQIPPVQILMLFG